MCSRVAPFTVTSLGMMLDLWLVYYDVYPIGLESVVDLFAESCKESVDKRKRLTMLAHVAHDARQTN